MSTETLISCTQRRTRARAVVNHECQYLPTYPYSGLQWHSSTNQWERAMVLAAASGNLAEACPLRGLRIP